MIAQAASFVKPPHPYQQESRYGYMASAKELFLELLKPDGRPERQLVQYEALAFALPDPVMLYVGAHLRPGFTGPDRWGTTIMFAEGAPGPTPIINEENKVLKDITRWREYVHAPDLAANCSEGWEHWAAAVRERAGSDKLTTAFMGTGIFEQCHFLMGFEDTLANLYEHPQEMHELIDYITDYRIQYAKMLIDGLQPEVLFSHDDWGTKEALFMNPDTWREFFKEPYRRFYGYIRSRGVITVHHADSYLADIVEDMAEIGIQVWQGVLPENDIPALQERLKGRMVLMGGVGAAIDRPDATEDEIRSYVRNVLETCCPGGHFIPSITYGLAGTVYPHVDPVISSEIERYNLEGHLPARRAEPLVRRRSVAAAPAAAAAESVSGSSDLLQQLASALVNGQKKQVLRLTEEALGAGLAAEDILGKGLLKGMETLGDSFSDGSAFVPELLLAGRCISAATELLKPHLSSGGTAHGRACIGTVLGDMHDIGKNLVKIMLEGAGLEVIDLGVNVSPEQFVETAKEEDCDLIVCSSLLTTTMEEMGEVVKAAEEAGIRDKVKILVGGAPITEEFCRAIGADAYAPDAGQAARTALELLGR